MIVSYAEGRVRLRFEQLKDAEISKAAREHISAVAGITSVEIKTVTGSILIEYDPSVLPTESLFTEGQKALKKLGITLHLPDRPVF